MEHFNAGGYFMWVCLVTKMKQRVFEENGHIEMVKIRIFYLTLNYELYQKREKDVRKVKSSKYVIAILCFTSSTTKKYRPLRWRKMFVFFFSVFSSTLHMSQHYRLNWSIDNR